MASVDDFLGGYQPPRVSVVITQRADLLARHADLQRAHAAAVKVDRETNANPTAPALLEELYAVEDEIAASEMTFTFEAIGRHRYMRLVTQPENRARKQDREAGLDFNAETFPQALIAKCAADPQITIEQANELCEKLSDSQFGKLWHAAVAVNVGDDAAPKSVRRSAAPASSATSSTTADPEESLEASSLAE